jgi:membrane-bound ClpP family serine protease
MLNSLTEWYLSLNGSGQFIWALAIVSSCIFLLQLILSLIGLDSDLDADIDLDGSGDFALFSFRAIISFLVFFSWTSGLLLHKGWSFKYAIIIGFIVGFIAMAIVAYLLYKITKMEESGNINLEALVGLSAEVYIPIPEGGKATGRVTVEMDEKNMEFDAVSEKQILTGNKVLVLKVLKNNILKVKSI